MSPLLAQSGHHDPLNRSPCVQAIERFGGPMKRIACLAAVAGAMVGVILYVASASGQSDEDASPIYGIKIPAGYRDWRLISVKQLAGNKLKQLRAQLGNDIAIEAFREGKLPFPDFVGRKRNALLYEIGIHSLPLR